MPKRVAKHFGLILFPKETPWSVAWLGPRQNSIDLSWRQSGAKGFGLKTVTFPIHENGRASRLLKCVETNESLAYASWAGLSKAQNVAKKVFRSFCISYSLLKQFPWWHWQLPPKTELILSVETPLSACLVAASLIKTQDCALHLESKRETGESGGNMLMTAKLPFSNLRISIQFPTGIVIVGSNSCRFWNLLVAGGGLVNPFELQKPRQRKRHILSWWAATSWSHGCFRQRG